MPLRENGALNDRTYREGGVFEGSIFGCLSRSFLVHHSERARSLLLALSSLEDLTSPWAEL